ncbi:hypothetical protein CCH79_00017397 [Gambusia affinis]|uniref:Calponin-homology (CH) domain-containing protein n=1 Tax=Gambusia affinis TaxID=33528 RepID=A0A315WQL1_GAMAF|nr:hypothetical protein CCH79_00017397 [Gambusia affinis]
MAVKQDGRCGRADITLNYGKQNNRRVASPLKGHMSLKRRLSSSSDERRRKMMKRRMMKELREYVPISSTLRPAGGAVGLHERAVAQPREKGRMRFHRLQNVQIALDFLKQRQISEIYVCGESADLTAKEKLLLWSQQATEGYPGLRCTNFSSAWSDGRMFNALLHRYRPDLINMEAVVRQSNRENLEQAFEIAESLGVTRLLDAEDVDVPSPDEKSVITYVSSIYDAFPKIPEGGEGIAAQEVDQRWSEYQSRFSSLLQWSRQQTALMAKKNFPQNPVELKVKLVNIRNDDITDGNPKLTLGLIWTIILHFQDHILELMVGGNPTED